jgi:cold shock CspA family protein
MRRFTHVANVISMLSVNAFINSQRDLTGKVRAWKHFSGYGFIVDSEGADYYTHRQELGGGFFLTEGQEVQFEAKKDDPTKSPRAIKVRNIDGTAITPIEISGVVSDIDGAGGIITELDVRGKVHPDSPTFPFSQDQIESASRISNGDPVRFAVDPQTLRAIRIVGRRLRKGSQSIIDDTKMSGTVRELRESFGFIASHDTNESIFFHKNDITGAAPIVVGDRVTFSKRVDDSRRNQGKPRAVDVTKF